MLNEVRNLSSMVTAFLNFARPQPLQLEQVNVVDLIADCATELEPLFQELKVELVVDAERRRNRCVRTSECCASRY